MDKEINSSNMLDVIRDMTYGLMDNFRRVILTCDLNKELYNQPLWKHIYHAMYWFNSCCCTPKILLVQIFIAIIYTHLM